MNLFAKANIALNQFIDVPVADPDDARRRKLLNIIISGTAVLSILLVVATTILSLVGSTQDAAGVRYIYVIGFIIFSFTIVFYVLNRTKKIPGWIVSGLFLLFLTIAIAFSDTPEQVASGQTLFAFTIPIIMASVLLAPSTSFIFSLFSSIIISLIALSINRLPNTPAIIGFFMIAIISWLSSRNLEQALRDLRQINTNLDNLVEEKTQELTKALARELVLAGRNQAVLESIADGVIVFDVHGKAIQANPALANLLERHVAVLSHSTVNDLLYDSPMDAKDRGILAGVLTKPEKRQASQRIGWGNKTLSVTSAQVYDSVGSTVGTVAVFRDITREAELEKMKSTFVAMVSHELRTPLSAILGYTEMFREAVYGPMNEKQLTMAERVYKNAQRLLKILNDLLDQAQMEAGRLKIQKEAFKPSELLENMHSVMEQLAAEKGLSLTSALDANIPETVMGDSARLQQILVNLVNNAVKFTDKGAVKVSIVKENEKEWKICVIDTGKGIPKEDIPHIFETFRQVEGTTTRLHGGFGIGLSIVKQLVNLMGGNIDVKSELEVGSTFTIMLPLELPIE